MYPGIADSLPPTEPEPEIHLSPLAISSLPINNTNPPPSPPVVYPNDEAPPSPFPAPGASTVNDLDDLESEIDKLDELNPPPDLDGEIAPTFHSDDDGPPPPPSDDENDTPPSSDDENDPPPPSDDEDDPNITLENMKLNFEFVRMVREATLESQLSPAELEAFQNPQELRFSPADDRYLRLSISFYISGLDHHSSERHYASSRENIQETWPDSEMLSYDQVKRRVSKLSGVLTWKNDMCVDSCAAFTGPFTPLEECPFCHKAHYNEEELAMLLSGPLSP